MFWFIPIIFWSGLAGGLAGRLVGFILDCLIDEETIDKEVLKVDDAFKYQIHSPDTRHVDVGIYDKDTNHLETIRLESEQGISSELKENHWYYL
ncbi:MAG: hypothetical protein K6A82_01875 [Prevotella sp.]|nr:hypothetical protein [Prevotella sp.]